MILKRFRICNYKVIDDTDWVQLDSRVTAFLGKNEAGKSSLLRAMWKCKNVADKKFDKLLDYPRDRYSPERKQSQDVALLEFELTPAESDALTAQFPKGSNVKPTTVRFTARYKGEEETETLVAFDDAAEAACLRTASECRPIVERLLASVAKFQGSEEATRALTAIQGELDVSSRLWDARTVQHMTALKTAFATWASADATRSDTALPERQQLDALIEQANQGDPASKARAWALENTPTFIYFDNYGQLETRINLTTYLSRIGNPDAKTRTQTALFQKSNLDPQEILRLGRVRDAGETDEQVQRRKDKRRALLDSASFGLTGEWSEWWNEKRHKLHFDADGDDLVLKVADDHNEFPIPFEERSHGFQWFFSFYLVFLVESAKAHKGAILLLDEPGLHLHPTLQHKLIHLFDRISEKNQLVYTTHLPFLVDGDHLERVRTVHLAGPDPQKTVVSNNVRPTGDQDTLFPLQAALGYSIAQTLFIGKRSVIVEGITDYWIIKALDAAVGSAAGAAGLHPDTVLIPTGGTSRLMPLASIMLATTGVGGRKMLVLLDSDTEGANAADRVTRELFADDSSRVMLLAPSMGMTHATIEDLVPRADYFAALVEAGFKVTQTAEDTRAATNVQAAEKAFARAGLGQLTKDHKAAAVLKLIDGWGKDPKRVPQETKSMALSLFAAINSRFEEPRA